MKDGPILLERSDRVAKITLNQPETLNALTDEMLVGLREFANEIKSDEEVRAVILTGAGRGFCSGANLMGGAGERIASGGMGFRAVIQEMNEVLCLIAEMEKPWIAAVNGPAVGGGCCLALVCDLVLAAESAYISAGYVNVGLVMDMGCTYLLPRLVGLHKANELAFFGERVYAEEAVKLGLINRSLPDRELMKGAREWAKRLASGPSLAIGTMKLGIRRGMHGSYRDTLNWEANMMALIAQTEDAAEGLSAFYQKREATFKGK